MGGFGRIFLPCLGDSVIPCGLRTSGYSEPSLGRYSDSGTYSALTGFIKLPVNFQILTFFRVYVSVQNHIPPPGIWQNLLSSTLFGFSFAPSAFILPIYLQFPFIFVFHPFSFTFLSSFPSPFSYFFPQAQVTMAGISLPLGGGGGWIFPVTIPCTVCLPIEFIHTVNMIIKSSKN